MKERERGGTCSMHGEVRTACFLLGKPGGKGVAWSEVGAARQGERGEDGKYLSA